MNHRHHATHAIGFFLGIVFLGGVSAGIGAHIGKPVIHDASALRVSGKPVDARRVERLKRRADQRMQRLLRRKRRLQRDDRVVSDVGVTYPMHTNPFSSHNAAQARQWDVSLNIGSLSYPRLGVTAPIGKPSITNWKNRDWRGVEDQMQYGMLNGVTSYPHSPNFGGKGSVIIAGHSSPPTLEALGSKYGDVFAVLPEAQIGDRVEVRDSFGNSYTYEVYDSREISATQTSILLQDPSKQDLILFTCYPVGTTRNRWAVSLRLTDV